MDEIRDTQVGGQFVIYTDIDTTPGNSDSPVISEADELIIGVHTGSIMSENYGTYINDNMREWIKTKTTGKTDT